MILLRSDIALLLIFIFLFQFFKATKNWPIVKNVTDMKHEWGEGNFKIEFFFIKDAVEAIHNVRRIKINTTSLIEYALDKSIVDN